MAAKSEKQLELHGHRHFSARCTTSRFPLCPRSKLSVHKSTEGWNVYLLLRVAVSNSIVIYQFCVYYFFFLFFFYVSCVAAWALPCLALVEWVKRSCTELFYAFSLNFLHVLCIAESSTKPEDSFNPVVHGSSLFSVMGQETCEFCQIFCFVFVFGWITYGR